MDAMAVGPMSPKRTSNSVQSEEKVGSTSPDIPRTSPDIPGHSPDIPGHPRTSPDIPGRGHTGQMPGKCRANVG